MRRTDWIRLALACFALGLVPVADAGEKLRIDGGSVEVVVAPDAEPAVRFAAVEMTNFLAQTFRRDVPLVTARTAGKTPILLGEGTRPREVAALPNLPFDGFRIVADANGVWIAGKDDPKIDPADRVRRPSWGAHKFNHGTLNGVYAFLESVAGARFYFAGELGTCIRPSDALVMPVGSIVKYPEMKDRRWGSFSDGEWYEGEDPNRAIHPMKSLNMFRLRAATESHGACHGLNGFAYVDRFGKTHPEYFAVNAKGERMIEGEGWQRGHLCLSSGIREEIFRDCLSYVKGEGPEVRGVPSLSRWGKGKWNYNCGKDGIDVMPQDGYAVCHCEKCQAAMRKDGRGSKMSEVVWGLVSELAARLRAEGYEPTLKMMSYADYTDPPDFALPTNIEVQVARTGPWAHAISGRTESDVAWFAKWEKTLGTKPYVWTYPNRDACNGLNLADVPAWAPNAWGEYYQAVAPHLSGLYAESESARCIDNLMGYYLLSRIGWKRSVNVRGIMDEFYDRMFGPAAGPMRQALEFVERKFTREVAGALRMTDIGPAANPPSDYRLWVEIYSESAMKELDGYFRKAAAAVPKGSLEARRVALFRRWMYDPPKRRGDAYREQTDVTRGLARDRASKAVNLVEEPGWKAFSCASWDDSDRCGWKRSIKVTKPDAKADGYGYFSKLKLKPSTKYRLSYNVKVENVVPASRGGGARALMLTDGKDRAGKSPAWTFPKTMNFLSGTVPWIRQSYEFETDANWNPDGCSCCLYLGLRYASGTAWFDGARIEEVGNALQDDGRSK